MAKSITKQITFPVQLLKVLEPKAKMYGYSFPAYVRYVLTKEMEKEFEKKQLTVLEKELSKGLDKSIKDYKKGRTIALDSDEAIDKFFETLENEE